MPRTAITPLALVADKGTTNAFVAADAVNGMQVKNAGIDGKLVLHVKNGDAAAKTVTLKACGINSYHPNSVDSVITVNATSESLIVLTDSSKYEQLDENFYIDFSAATSVTVAVYKLP